MLLQSKPTCRICETETIQNHQGHEEEHQAQRFDECATHNTNNTHSVVDEHGDTVQGGGGGGVGGRKRNEQKQSSSNPDIIASCSTGDLPSSSVTPDTSKRSPAEMRRRYKERQMKFMDSAMTDYVKSLQKQKLCKGAKQSRSLLSPVNSQQSRTMQGGRKKPLIQDSKETLGGNQNETTPLESKTSDLVPISETLDISLVKTKKFLSSDSLFSQHFLTKSERTFPFRKKKKNQLYIASEYSDTLSSRSLSSKNGAKTWPKYSQNFSSSTARKNSPSSHHNESNMERSQSAGSLRHHTVQGMSLHRPQAKDLSPVLPQKRRSFSKKSAAIPSEASNSSTANVMGSTKKTNVEATFASPVQLVTPQRKDSLLIVSRQRSAEDLRKSKVPVQDKQITSTGVNTYGSPAWESEKNQDTIPSRLLTMTPLTRPIKMRASSTGCLGERNCRFLTSPFTATSGGRSADSSPMIPRKKDSLRKAEEIVTGKTKTTQGTRHKGVSLSESRDFSPVLPKKSNSLHREKEHKSLSFEVKKELGQKCTSQTPRQSFTSSKGGDSCSLSTLSMSNHSRLLDRSDRSMQSLAHRFSNHTASTMSTLSNSSASIVASVFSQNLSEEQKTRWQNLQKEASESPKSKFNFLKDASKRSSICSVESQLSMSTTYTWEKHLLSGILEATEGLSSSVLEPETLHDSNFTGDSEVPNVDVSIDSDVEESSTNGSSHRISSGQQQLQKQKKWPEDRRNVRSLNNLDALSVSTKNECLSTDGSSNYTWRSGAMSLVHSKKKSNEPPKTIASKHILEDWSECGTVSLGQPLRNDTRWSSNGSEMTTLPLNRGGKFQLSSSSGQSRYTRSSRKTRSVQNLDDLSSGVSITSSDTMYTNSRWSSTGSEKDLAALTVQDKKNQRRFESRLDMAPVSGEQLKTMKALLINNLQGTRRSSSVGMRPQSTPDFLNIGDSDCMPVTRWEALPSQHQDSNADKSPTLQGMMARKRILPRS